MKLGLYSKVVLVAFGFSSLAFGEGTPKLEEHKAKAVRTAEQDILLIEQRKSCIAGAENREAVKACYEKFKSEKNKQRDERKVLKRQQIDSKIKQLEEKKEQLEESDKK